VNLAGKRALITGGTSGIGMQIGLALAGRGVTVLVTGRDTTPLAEDLDPSFARMLREVLARALAVGLERERAQITPGQSLLLKGLGPGLASRILNRGLPDAHPTRKSP